MLLEKVKEAALNPPPEAHRDPVRRSVGRAINVILALVLALVVIAGYGLYRAGHGLMGFFQHHGPHTINSATIDGKVTLGLPKAASQLMGATAPYNVGVTVGKGFGGDWKYLHGKWGVWNSVGTVGFDIDYSRIQPLANTQTRTETLVMPLPQLLPASIHEASGKWSDGPHCGVTGHFMSVVSLGFDHACSLDSGDPKVRSAIDQAVASQVPHNQAAMQQAEQGAESKFGPFVASIIKSVTGQVYTIKFVWPSQ